MIVKIVLVFDGVFFVFFQVILISSGLCHPVSHSKSSRFINGVHANKQIKRKKKQIFAFLYYVKYIEIKFIMVDRSLP